MPEIVGFFGHKMEEYLENENKYCVYKHTNKVNGKVYIGQTKQSPKKRWRRGKGYESNKYFYDDIVKYGWDGFEHEILFDKLSEKKANFLEQFMIMRCESRNPSKGYNILVGGDNHSIPKRVRKVLSEKAAKKKVLCVEKKIVYNSIAEAARKNNLSYQHISDCCNGRVWTCGGYQWRFYKK